MLPLLSCPSPMKTLIQTNLGVRPYKANQLNVRNLTNEDEYMPLRYNDHYSGYARVLLVDPRQFRASVGLGF